MNRTASDWSAILFSCGVDQTTAAKWSPVFADTINADTFSAGDKDIQEFLGQILHESGLLTITEENLNYRTPERIRAVWPLRFPTLTDAAPYAKNPQALANKVYGGRLGNTTPGDGWKYRGRGLLQCTGRDCYREVGAKLGADFEGSPELLAQPEYALRAAIAWWEGHIPDSVLGNIQRETKIVNGGQIGIDDRIALTEKARKAMV
jgi:putative chitinase